MRGTERQWANEWASESKQEFIVFLLFVFFLEFFRIWIFWLKGSKPRICTTRTTRCFSHDTQINGEKTKTTNNRVRCRVHPNRKSIIANNNQTNSSISWNWIDGSIQCILLSHCRIHSHWFRNTHILKFYTFRLLQHTCSFCSRTTARVQWVQYSS